MGGLTAMPIFANVQVSSNETLTIQLLGKDDLTIDDASTMEQKWRQYIDSFVLVSL